ncbi:methionine ABC transporter ATP-binding protein [Acinetobacter rudis]|uniref:methionine ABC transporter ATP-binding protein n=1 Tax=Acinetobacter rudis TaxID=632955 RepID=UPI0033424597
MLKIEHLYKSYAHTTAESIPILKDINLCVPKKSIAAVLGPSGSGKSTLSKCVNLLERPSSGNIKIDDLDLTHLSEQDLRVHRRNIGTIFQSSSLLSLRTVAENVALPLRYLGVTDQNIKTRVSELLDNVGLLDRANHYPDQLSGGQKQRVGIARALALKPKILLADEATSGLDPESTTAILNLIHRLKNELELSVVLITHEMDVVRQIADQVYVLNTGEIVEQGSLHDLILNPQSIIGKQLLPLNRPQNIPTGLSLLEVRYQHHPDQHNYWMSNLSEHLQHGVQLISANIEEISGLTIARALIGIPAIKINNAINFLNNNKILSMQEPHIPC